MNDGAHRDCQLSLIVAATQPMFRSGLLSDGLFSNIKAAMLSVSATSSGDGALALERAADCFDEAAQLRDQSDALATRCFTASSGPLIALETAYASIVQQGVGYLPPNLLVGIVNSASRMGVGMADAGSRQLLHVALQSRAGRAAAQPRQQRHAVVRRLAQRRGQHPWRPAHRRLPQQPARVRDGAQDAHLHL